MDLILVGVSILIGIYILKQYFAEHRRNKLIDAIPGPKTQIVLGNSLLFKGTGDQVLATFGKLHTEYGDIFRTWHASRPVVHLVGPQYVETILGANKHIRKGKIYSFLLPWLGTGLLTSDGKKWFTHRKLITPTFHFKVLENFTEIFNECSRVLVDQLKKKAGKNYFDIYPFITKCALDIICETAMGTEIEAQKSEENPFVAATLKISELIVQRQFTPWLHPDFIFYNTKLGYEFNEQLRILHNFTKNVIRERKASRQKKSLNDAQSSMDNSGVKSRSAFLDLLLDSADSHSVPLTDVEIREEVDTFMFEGHDTTTTAISWTLLMLGNHPEIQSSVRDELKAIFEGSDRSATLRDLGEMKLLERVIKESLRLYPSVTIITRILDHDTKIGQFMVPAQTNVALHIFAMQRHPDIYPDPLKFDPNRFLPEQTKKRHPYAYIPFSAGQRNCIGQKFAMYEEKVMISTILRKFKVEALHTAADVPPVHELVNRPKTGVHIRLSPL